MSRTGSATELWYATAPKSVPVLRASIERKGHNAKVVCTVDLVAAFGEGVLRFSDDLAHDDVAQQRAAERIKVWLGFVPARPLVEAWEQGK
jgi:hypothetical protein